jgi:hypothetical protein
LTRRGSMVVCAQSVPLLLLVAASWMPSSGCALFQDLGTDSYRVTGGGDGGSCAGDGGCHPTIACSPGCPSSQVCCVSPGADASLDAACVASSACSGVGDIQLCENADDCESGTCIGQTCSFGATFAIHACTMVPFICSPL